MKNLDIYFQTMRDFRKNQLKVRDQTHKDVERLAQYRGSEFYESEMADIDAKRNAAWKKNRDTARQSIQNICDKMRQVSNKQHFVAPSADMVSTIQLLQMADHLTPAELYNFAAQMKDCPLALKIMGQIALNYNIMIRQPDYEHIQRRIDRLQQGAEYFIDNFTDPDLDTPDTIMFNSRYGRRFFGDVDMYTGSTDWTSEISELAWLKEITGHHDGSCFEENGGGAVPDVLYEFENSKQLSEFIDRVTQGLDGRAKEIKLQEIWDASPENYSACYREFLATRESRKLKETVEALEADFEGVNLEYSEAESANVDVAAPVPV